MKKYSFQMTKKEARELCFRAIWEQLRLQRVKCLLILIILALEGVFLSWGISLVTFFALLLMLASAMVRDCLAMQKMLCGKTRTIWVEDGMLKQDSELHREILCNSITEIRRTRHLLMLGFRQAAKVLTWYPIPLRVFADERERDSFVESVRNPQVQAQEESAAPGMGEHGGISAADLGTQAAEESGQEYFHVSAQIGEEEWVRMMAAGIENVRIGFWAKQRKCILLIILAAVMFTCTIISIRDLTYTADLVYAVSLIGMICDLHLLRLLLENPKKRIRKQIRKGLVQNNVQGLWEMFITETGIRQNMPGEKSIVMPWESLIYMVETDTDLVFFQNDKRHYSMFPKEELENQGQLLNLKHLCRTKQVEVLLGKRKKYLPNWFFSLLTVVVLAAYVVIYVRM